MLRHYFNFLTNDQQRFFAANPRLRKYLETGYYERPRMGHLHHNVLSSRNMTISLRLQLALLTMSQVHHAVCPPTVVSSREMWDSTCPCHYPLSTYLDMFGNEGPSSLCFACFESSCIFGSHHFRHTAGAPSPSISRCGEKPITPHCGMIRSNVWRYIDKALKDGYTIVHKALLLSSPIPTADNIPKFRTTFVHVEAALTRIFGPFRHHEKGFGDLCPWTQDLFEWTGLCSHSPLLEAPHGDLKLSPDQLKEMAAITSKSR